MAKKWQSLLQEKVNTDPTWPFDASLEFYDVESDMTVTENMLTWRFGNASAGLMPPVTAIFAPETNGMYFIIFSSLFLIRKDESMTFSPSHRSIHFLPGVGGVAAMFGSKYNIPVMSSVLAPDPINPVQPEFLNTTFMVQPPAQFQFQEFVDSFGAIGVKSMVTVALYEPYDSYNADSCSGTATLAASRNVDVKEKIIIYQNYTQTDIQRVIRRIREQHNPDSILWCDWASCAYNAESMNPLYAFKEVNYLPKALAMLDCIDQPGVKPLYDKGLFQYVSSGQYVSEKLQVRICCKGVHQCFYFLLKFTFLCHVTHPSASLPCPFPLLPCSHLCLALLSHGPPYGRESTIPKTPTLTPLTFDPKPTSSPSPMPSTWDPSMTPPPVPNCSSIGIAKKPAIPSPTRPS